MSQGLAFWIVFLLTLVICLAHPFWPVWPGWVGNLLVLFLLALLGWSVFGRPIH